MKKMIKKLKNQRGSALLLTLGILSLVLIMAMSFAFSARTTRQVAKVNADQVKARLLAESALERVIAAMKTNYDGDEAGDVYPPEKTAGWQFQSSSVPSGSSQKYLASTDSGSDTYDLSGNESYLPILSNFSTLPTVEYQAIQVGAKTIGRVAFLVLEEANKLDINQMLTLRMTNSTPKDNRPFVLFDTTLATPAYTGVLPSLHHNFANIRGDFLYDISATELTLTQVDETNTVRLGLNMQEIRIDGLYRSLLPAGFPGSAAPPSAGTVTPWFSYRHLWNVVWDTTASPVLSVADALKYTFFSGEDIEAYWDGTDERQRFDITGFEWGSSTGDFFVTDPVNPAKYILNPVRSGWHHAGTLAGAQTLVNALVADDDRELFWDTTNPSLVLDSPTVGDTGFGIPYLKDLEDATANHGKQVAANMVDFCDSDSFATTDATWAGAVPTYCGNERVAYINEVKLDFIIQKEEVDSTVTPATFQIKAFVAPSVELLNIYENLTTPYAGDVKIVVNGNYTIDANDSVPFLTTFIPADQSSFADGSHPGYHLREFLSLPFYVGLETSSEITEFTIAITSFTVLFGVNDNNEQIYDCAYVKCASLHTSPPLPVISFDLTSSFNPGDFKAYSASFEVSDPRCNTNSGAWSCLLGDDIAKIGSMGETNSFLDSTQFSNCDLEATPMVFNNGGPGYATFSTAFIADRPFRSLWELGAIHRGQPFRTLAIAGADSAILDQVKIGPLKKTMGKFNANSTNPSAFVELLKGINITDHYDGSCSYLTPSYTTPATLDTTVSENRGVFATRIPSSGLYNLEPANDREREALIGRTANLLTTRVDKYSVLVVGQALNHIDLPTSVTVTPQMLETFINPVQYPDGSGDYYSILSTQRILAYIVRDAWRNEYKVVQMQLLED